VTDNAIYLASRSPRRQELLRQIGVDFELLKLRTAPGRHLDVIEETRDGEPPLHYVERIARTKASVGWIECWSASFPRVPYWARIPRSCARMSSSASPRMPMRPAQCSNDCPGRKHDVISAIALRWQDDVEVVLSVTHVTMRRLTAREITRYVASGEPFDKAGGYAIQGLAAMFITRIDGSYSGVMGLPLAETAAALTRIGRPVL
jgi:septum formation protein